VSDQKVGRVPLSDSHFRVVIEMMMFYGRLTHIDFEGIGMIYG
jgi:hypothetical protein